MYFKGNNKINKIIKNATNEHTVIKFKPEEIISLFNKKIIKIFEAHIIEESGEHVSVDTIKNNYEELICMNTDITGYECSVNEFRLVDSCEPNSFKLSESQQFVLGKVVMENLITKKNFPIPSVVYFTFDEGNLSMRFHKYRQNEGLWISKELESYDTPVGYYYLDSMNTDI